MRRDDVRQGSGARTWLLLGAILLAMASVTPAAQSWTLPYPSYQTREDYRDDGNYLVGTLNWQEGKGGISWTGRTSEGPAGPAKDVDADRQQFLSAKSKSRVGPTPKPVEFVSDPLPFDVYPNPARLIQLDLMVVQPSDPSNENAPACPRITWVHSSSEAAPEVRLFLGSSVMAGAPINTALHVPLSDKDMIPADPPGHNVCLYRMGVEVGFIPAGEQLRLAIAPTLLSNRIYQYGVSPLASSVLRIPYFPPDEVLYRYNDTRFESKFVADEETSGDGSQGGADLMVAGAGPALLGGLGLCIAIPRTRRRAVVALLVLALAGPVFAGCLGKGAPSGNATQPGGITSTLQSGDATAVGGEGMGAIVGLVHDDMNLPVSGVHVALLGTAYAGYSDGLGRFQFKGLTPGEYDLRLDHAEYGALERNLRVEASKITRADVTLIPLNAKNSGERNHFHDYWQNGPSEQIADLEIPPQCYDTCSPGTYFSIPRGETGKLPNTVRPGTENVEVTITWDPVKMGQRRVALGVYANNDNNWTYYSARGPGEPFNVRSTWEMTDQGHQAVSTWYFRIFGVPEDRPAADVNVATSDPPLFHAKIVVHGGVVPLERPHPDHWGDAERLKIGSTVFTGQGSSGALLQGCALGLGYHFTWNPTSIIPVGTKWLEIVLYQDRPSGVGPVGQFDWVLRYKPASVPKSDYKFPRFGALPEPNPDYQTAPDPSVTNGGLKSTWRFEIEDIDADAIYATSSAWTFVLEPEDENQACLDRQQFALQSPTASKILTLGMHVRAHRDAMSE